MATCYTKGMSYDSEKWSNPNTVLFTPSPDMKVLSILFEFLASLQGVYGVQCVFLQLYMVLG